MPIYMKYEGIKGMVTDKDHEGWIELYSAQTGTAQTAPQSSEVVVTRISDQISPLLFKESLSGESKKVTIHFVEINAGKPRVYLSIELEGVMISSYSISGRSPEDRSMESLSLNFTKITYSAKPAEVPKKADNKSNKSMWDLIMGKQP